MPKIYIIAGSNGSGKTTLANTLLPEFLHCKEFVNADLIAAGLSPFNVESVALQAGRLMLERISDLAKRWQDFAFETTLSTLSYAEHIKKWREAGYEVHLIFLWLDSVEISIERVKCRVASGGHNIPEATIRRRYQRGLHNFFHIYKNMVTSWEVYDNSSLETVSLVSAHSNNNLRIYNEDIWNKIRNL